MLTREHTFGAGYHVRLPFHVANAQVTVGVVVIHRVANSIRVGMTADTGRRRILSEIRRPDLSIFGVEVSGAINLQRICSE
jgi:hypothetical protein